MSRVLLGLVVTAVCLVAGGSAAQAQLPLHVSVNAGAAIPVRSEADTHGVGFHLGAALGVPLIPVQLEGSFDRMGAEGVGEDLTIWGAALKLSVDVTPALLPVGVYLLGSGGLFRHDAEISGTDFGLSAGGGVRLKGMPALQPYLEGRGVVIFRENRITYLTAALGLRF